MQQSRKILILITIMLVATMIVGACSDDTQNEADEAGDAIETAVDESGDVVEEAGEDIEEGAEEVAEDIEEAGEEAEEDVEALATDVDEAAEDVEEDVKEASEEIEEGAEEVAEDVEEVGEEIDQEIDEIAEESEVHLNSFKTNIFVASQAIGNDTVVIEEVEFDDPGFVIIHADDGDGNPGEVIGNMAIEAEEMEEFSIEIDRELVTPTLHVMLHEDTGEDGVFEFGDVEDTDNPVEIDGDVAVVSFEVYMIEPADEAYNEADNTLTLEAVVSPVNTWIVVYSDEDREDRIGMALVEAGRNEDVVIELDEDSEVGDVVWIVLHDDTGEEGEFEFDDDDEIDDPIVVNLDEVRFSIDLATEETETEADEE
jgi:hypothetical protein